MVTRFLLALCILFAAVSAKIQDLCRQGSDAECARYGENMCCARIQYTFKSDSQDFHACASKIGIENANGQIYDSFGFSGTWHCAGAFQGIAMSVAASLTIA
jgi:hypothetical protein